MTLAHLTAAGTARPETAGPARPEMEHVGQNVTLRFSTLDVAGPGFALLADQGHDLWQRAAAEAGKSLGVAVAVQPIALCL